MPLKPPAPSPQLINFTTMQAILGQITKAGVPVANIREVDNEGGSMVAVAITDPNFEPDNGTYQYLANVFGTQTDIEVGLIPATVGTGGWNGFVKLGEQAFANAGGSVSGYDLSVAAILALPVAGSTPSQPMTVQSTIDALLPFSAPTS
jgi:hypothetical protein